MGKTKAVLLGLALCLVAGASQALPIQVDGSIVEFVDSAGNTIGHTIDYITFDVAAGTGVGFNVMAYELNWSVYPPVAVDLNGDGESTWLDPLIRLFDANGNELASNDDNGSLAAFADGSVDPIDSYLEYNFANAGTYTLYISGFWMEASDIALGYNPEQYESLGDYRVTFETEGGVSNVRRGTLGEAQSSVVPEPASLSLMGLGLGGLALRRLRRRG